MIQLKSLQHTISTLVSLSLHNLFITTPDTIFISLVKVINATQYLIIALMIPDYINNCPILLMVYNPLLSIVFYLLIRHTFMLHQYHHPPLYLSLLTLRLT